MFCMKRTFGILCVNFLIQVTHLNAFTGYKFNLDDDQPYFASPLQNVSVPIGREATLSCIVNNLGTYKLGWMKSDQTVLALATKVVTQNSRFMVAKEEPNIWKLKIKSVKPSDRGCYMCQINTSPLQKQLGCVDVHVPPDILNDKSSGDETIREGESVSFHCSAEGHPQPRIVWRRSDGSPIWFNGNSTEKVDMHSGNFLNLTNVQRKQIGAYLCIASNDVPPAVSKRVFLGVQFAPNVSTTKNLYGVYEASNTTLECIIEAYPMPVNNWIKGSLLLQHDDTGRPAAAMTTTNITAHVLAWSSAVEATGHNGIHNSEDEIISLSKKYEIHEEKLSPYKSKMLLKIINFNEADAGAYSCISANTFGKTNKTIRIYEMKRPTTTTEATTTTTTTQTSPPTTTAKTSTTPTIETTEFPVTSRMFRWLFTSTTTTLPTDNYYADHFTPPNHHLDHYIGETYLNQPTSIFSGSTKLVASNFAFSLIITMIR